MKKGNKEVVHSLERELKKMRLQVEEHIERTDEAEKDLLLMSRKQETVKEEALNVAQSTTEQLESHRREMMEMRRKVQVFPCCAGNYWTLTALLVGRSNKCIWRPQKTKKRCCWTCAS